jgi:HSP20 family protein
MRPAEYPLQEFREELESMFRRFFGGWLEPFEGDYGSMRTWDFDVSEGDNEIIVKAELPGFEEKELDVQLSDNILTIKAEKEQKGDGRESYRSFRQSVTLPSGIDANKVQASYHNGVLELHIPRAEGAKPKRIAVKAQ